ncbi:MAG: hypothetical protein A3A43_00375 [Candidatus Liptonbacteria bacterium RIFCSPLOWO2_01_FULL_56_20]|uniref:Uncharacterized protein n=1 Tax=Candidatus Liptonbacteria bacterium RIFCSPLOWO2_01_FULL_56_20 TaxID=1798652 RepID=A0A1G2CI76_9BACT|nr:MAG: hypothetical protein UY96_C0011G0043 [Parcubacteria group bacterium GW2011_GWB1_56_8]OGY98124.1 MAG: hypothetical protein A2681_02760 [Candidatus Liptonbacteria bacterium RIFCSPHIGHO2_01_FULL_56_18b]OGZ01085.1 MAG: hypothetical protein A3A43_00375 [Candidatus Liptonbacteria bacterium RIFCSPLOWO2_01_FULL_56_20]
MAEFILTDILMVALGVFLFLVVRSLPRIVEDDAPPVRHTVLDRWITSEIPHKIDEAMASYSGKFFRKLKVLLMRLDNFLTERLKKMNAGANGAAKPKIDSFDKLRINTDRSRSVDFKEITGDNNVAKSDAEE